MLTFTQFTTEDINYNIVLITMPPRLSNYPNNTLYKHMWICNHRFSLLYFGSVELII